MKTIETKLYSFKELSEAAQERIIKRKADNIANEPDDFTLSECMDSLKAIAEACNLKLRDWNIGPYNRNNFCRVDCDDEGNKAIARFARVLMRHKYPRPGKFKEYKLPGICGFTGVCFDDDICEEIWKGLLDGDTLGKCFDHAAQRIQTICEDDLECRQTREAILEYLDQDEEVYTEEGDEF